MNKKTLIGFIVIILVIIIIALYFSKPNSLYQPVEKIDKSTTLNQYKDDIYGIEFMYNSEWSVSEINGGDVDYTKPYIFIRVGETTDVPCNDLNCPPESGDRDVLTKRYTLEGAPPLNPYFKILRVRGNKWVTIQVTDALTDCPSQSFCDNYIDNAPLQVRSKLDNIDYQTYNDFIDLLSTFRFTK